MKTMHFEMFKSNIKAKKKSVTCHINRQTIKIIVNFYEGFYHEGDKRLFFL
jgi:hypothetical protein